MCDLKHGRIAAKWQNRAEAYTKEHGTDCDATHIPILKEMQAEGLVLGKDVVVVRGSIGDEKHMCLEMYGSNCKPKNGKPVFEFNGYRIDGTAYSAKFDSMWKGAYNEN